MGELILLRHGQTEWSKNGRHTGRTDIPLTPEGEQAAKALAPALAARHVRAALTSPAQRAARTRGAGRAETPADATPEECGDYGGYEGLTTPQIEAAAPRPGPCGATG